MMKGLSKNVKNHEILLLFHYSVRQKIGDPGSISTQNMFPLIPVVPEPPQLPYGAKYVLLTILRMGWNSATLASSENVLCATGWRSPAPAVERQAPSSALCDGCRLGVAVFTCLLKSLSFSKLALSSFREMLVCAIVNSMAWILRLRRRI